MVPIIPLSELDRDPLVVFAEPYNTLILDGKGFKSSIPRVKGLAPKTNIKAWVDRKAFIHNLGHAAAAYYGYHLHPDSLYMYEILDDKKVYNFTRSVMLQSADILRVSHPGEFSAADLQDHIDDLIKRFMNKALQDTIYRVGQDLPRKLGCDDRFMSPIHLAIEHSMPYNLIIKAMTYGLFFRARSEEGNLYPADKAFLDKLEQDFDATLMNDLGLDITADLLLVKELTQQYAQIQHNLNL
jgi:mannitol-1-phosphate 5-dehydrogenase